MIGITQPRRVAAVSMAARVQAEMTSENTPEMAELVGHQIRYDRTTSKKTRVKFMTDGILLREIQDDFLLNKYSSIIIDEGMSTAERKTSPQQSPSTTTRLKPIATERTSTSSNHRRKQPNYNSVNLFRPLPPTAYANKPTTT